MAEVIKNFKEPICVIPKQSLLAAALSQAEHSLRLKRTDAAKKAAQIEIDRAKAELNSYLVSIGREPRA